MKTAYIVLAIIAAITVWIIYKQGGFRRLGTHETGTSSVYTKESLQ